MKTSRLYEILFIFILSLTPLLWFKDSTILVGHDNTYPLEAKGFLQNRLYTWTDSSFGYDQSLIMGTIPIHLIDAIPTYLGFSAQSGQKIVYVFWFFLIGLSAYVLASYLKPKNTQFKLTASTLYQFNFFILQAWWIGEKSKFSAYIALPLLLTVFFAVYRKRISLKRGIVFNTLTLFFFNGGGIFGVPLFGGVLITLFAFFAFFSYYSLRSKKKFGATLRLAIILLATGIGYLLINAYYIFPALYRIGTAFTTGVAATGGLAGILDWTREISANTSVINLIRLQGIPEWYDNPEHPYSGLYLNNPLLIGLSFLWPFLAVTSIVAHYRKRNYVVIFLFFTYLLSILFAGGTHAPFGIIYEFLLKYLPGFLVFRTPYFKFAPPLFLTTAFLTAYLFNTIKGKKSYIIGGLFLAIWISYHFPYFTGDFFAWRKGFSTRLNIPDYVYKFNDWAKSEKKDTDRIVLIPPLNDRWSYETYSWGYLSLTPLNELFGSYPAVSNSIRLQSNELSLVRTMYSSLKDHNYIAFNRIARQLGIKYILLREDVSLDSEFGVSNDFSSFQNSIYKNSALSLHKKFGPWKVYKLGEPDSLFYTTSKINYIDGAPDLPTLEAYYNIPGSIEASFYFDNPIVSAPLRSQHMLIPTCITCQSLFRPLIIIKPRLILPNSVFYPLVLKKEQQLLDLQITPRDRINTNLGFTLKRLSELERMFEIDKIDIYPVFNLFQDELENIRKNFADLENDNEKYNVATDLHWYLKYQIDYLEALYGEQLRNDRDIERLTEVITYMRDLLAHIRPFSMVDLAEDTRIFRLYVPKKGLYRLFINKNHLSTVAEDGIKLDNQILPINVNATAAGEWMPMDEVLLTQGEHVVRTVQTNIKNRIGNFIQSPNKEFKNALCYEAEVQDAKKNKLYKLKVATTKGFTEDPEIFNINLFIKKSAPGGEESETVLKPYSKISMVYEEKVHTHGAFDKITLTMCGNNLQHEDLQTVYTISVSEIVERPLLFLQTDNSFPEMTEQSFTKESPTNYKMQLTVDKPTILVFNSAFDKGWQLSGFDNNHFMINGFANAWLLDKSGTYNLTLTYFPQKLFYIGLATTVISLITAVVLLR